MDDAILDLTERQMPKGQARYSYASVADTFFWGEKRRYLPGFQAARAKSEAQDAMPYPGLHIIGGTSAARKE